MSNKYPGGIITSGANAGYSVAFDGTGDYLSIVDQAAFYLGTNNFTMEGWFYATGYPNYARLFGQCTRGATGNNSIGFFFDTGGNGATCNMRWGTTTNQTNDSGYITVNAGKNQWHHIAAARDGNTLRMYFDGVQVYSTSVTGVTFYNSTADFRVGADSESPPAEYWQGYIANVRLVNGTCLYPNGTTFTPPTQLFNITNTSLLTCNSPAIVDQSSNAFTITANGDAKVSTFTPFTGYTAYNPALGAATPGVWTITDALQAAQTRRWNMYDPYFNLTTLLLHGNGTNGAQNNTFLDSSSNNFSITRNGNTTQGTFSPFSQTGWSNYFNGSSDYLTAANNTALQLGSSDFTIEGWVYVSASSASLQTFLAKGTGAGNQASYAIQLNTSNQWVYYLSGNGSTWSIASGVVMGSATLNAWNHVALVRSGSTFTPYVNGVAGTTTTSATALFAGTAVLSIGADDAGTSKLNGYVSNARVVKGTAVYTSNFTPPTAPLTAITNTQLLTCQSNRFLDNSSNAFAITVNGTPSVQAFSPFLTNVAYTPTNQGGSGYFDGTGDNISVPSATALQLNTSVNWTIEAWVYPTTLSGDNGIIAKRGASTEYQLSHNSGIGLNIYTGATTYGSGKLLTVNQWQHCAATWDGTTLRFFVNGVQTPTTHTGISLPASSTNNFTVGANGTTEYFTGYICGARLVKGTAVYTASFTPPTAPPTAITNTSFLCNFTNAGITDATAKNDLETVGNAQISTTRSKFGGTSMYFNGSPSRIDSKFTPNQNLGGGDWTIEFWMLMPTVPTTFNSIAGASNGGGGVPKWIISVNMNTGYTYQANRFMFATYNGADRQINVPYTWVADTWYHVALACVSGTTTLYINGISQGSMAYNIPTTITGGISVGGDAESYGYFNGYIDDFRVTKGYARYTANFTPQTSQWQDQ